VTYRVLLRTEARDDLNEAASWYEERRSELGGEFLDEVRVALERISIAPLSYPAVYRGLRRSLVRRFPFAIYFRPGEQVVTVVAVMHGSRSPTAWQVRT
jgi:plasmid stabilization system protein ParE